MTRSLMRGLSILALAGMGLMAPPLAAQSADPDVLFRQALDLPRDRREEAKALCRKALEGHPDYHDVRIQLARMEAWDGRYEEARREIGYVLKRQPGNLEAREAAMDFEVWADRETEALRLCNEGLALDPASLPLHRRRARLLKATGDLERAQMETEVVLAAVPDDQAMRLLRDDLRELRQRSKVTLSYTYDHFSETFEPWRQYGLGVGHRFDFGSVNVNFNRAWRFGSWGSQYEVEAYPHLGEGTYAWLEAARSTDSIFPKFRDGAEVFHNFSHGIEASLGFRHLHFDGSQVTLYTAMGAKYLGNALYALRIYVTPGTSGTSKSGSLSGRWFGSDPDNYLNASVGTGYSPDYFPWAASVLTMHSRSASLGGQRKLARAWLGSAKLAWSRQEYLPDTWRTDMTYDASLTYRF